MTCLSILVATALIASSIAADTAVIKIGVPAIPTDLHDNRLCKGNQR